MNRTSYLQELEESPFRVSDLILVLEEINEQFYPNLQSRLFYKSDVTTFEDYIEKLLTKGKILVHYNQEEIEGFIMFYADDVESLRAYIPLIAVRSKYQCKGIAKKLLIESISRIKKTSMKTIRVKTWINNFNAISLYKNYGFTITAIEEPDLILEFILE